MSLIRELFHTQEKWRAKLASPIITTNKEAWLGEGYYFWYYEHDAVWWGNNAKRRTHYYEVYKASIECEDVLDTVFNEQHYNFWIDKIDKAIAKFLKNNSNALTIKYLNDYFKEKGLYDGVTGVMFQDISWNKELWIIDKFQYKKRIQLAVYNESIITNFAFHFESECV